MVTTTTTAAPILAPSDVAELFTAPLLAVSVAAQVSTVVTTGTRAFRIPRVSADPSAAWVNEGQEINPSDATLDEITVTPSKLAGLTIITRELADDSSPEAAQIVGDGLARDCARKLDAAYFGNLAAPAPKGLGSLTGAGGATVVSAGATGSPWANLDPFSAAIFEASNRNAVLGSWVANPADALGLATVKQASGSNQALLQPDPTAPSRNLIAGLPLLVSTAVPVGTVYGIASAISLLVVRDDVSIDRDDSAFFTSDRVAIRARMRVGFAFPQPQAVVKIVKA